MMEDFNTEIRWFMQYGGRVQGPFDTDSMQNTLDRLDATHLDQTLLWRRGLAEWIKASKWQSGEHAMMMMSAPAAPENTQSTLAASTLAAHPMPPPPKQQLPPQAFHQPQPPPPVPPAPKSTAPVISDEATSVGPRGSQKLAPGAFYRVQLNFVDQPMMTKNELLNLIAKQEDISTVAIQDPKTKDWKEVYAFPDIVEKLGLSRRKHQRVPILAQFQGRSNRHESFMARIITISEGGIGLTEIHDLKIGDEVEGQMTSPHFFQPINIRAEVVYSGLDGYIGLNFTQINEESKAAIIDYMKKFGRGSAQPGS